MKDIRRMYVPSGKKPSVIKNSTTRKRSTRKGYKSPSNKSINTLSNPNYSNTGNIMYRKGIKNIIGSGHQSVNEGGGDFKQTQQNQFTLPDGRTIELPTFTENLPTTTSRDYYTCENDWCCTWDGSSNNQSDVSGNNYVYPQSDFAYSKANFAFPQNFYLMMGTIYIDGVPSTNPLACEDKCEAQENCILEFTAYTLYPDQCQMFPNYGMYGWNNPTGNADAISTVSKGKIVGFDFVNNIRTWETGGGIQTPTEGIIIPIQHQQGQLTLPCYPNVGDKIDDLILYKADTGTYYQLTQESYNIFINAVVPIAPFGGFSVILNDLYFEPWNGGYSNYSLGGYCSDCKTICPDWYNDAACSQDCEYFGKSKGCRYNYEGPDNPNNGCFCNNPELGCCDEGSFLPEPNNCRVDNDCRPGSVCIRNKCVFQPPQPPQELSTLNCRCTKINNCDELFGELLCNICSDFESFILNQSNYAYSDGQAYVDNDPLYFYKKILNFSYSNLNKKGKLYFEINSLYSDELNNYMIFKNLNYEILKDLSKKDRFLKINF